MRVQRALVSAAALILAVLGVAARAEEPAPEDPPLCRDAIAARPQQAALAALAEAEQDAARRAGRRKRAAAKPMRKHRRRQ
jgi:hypothetical protein